MAADFSFVIGITTDARLNGAQVLDVSGACRCRVWTCTAIFRDGSRAAVAGRLMVQPVYPQLRK